MQSLVKCVALLVSLGCVANCEAETDTNDPTAIEDVVALDERPCPDNSPLNYDNFGGPFMLSWCSGCHASGLPADERQGAPLGSDFDTLDQIRQASAEIWQRSADHNRSMPPQAGPGDEERAMLGEWLACGAR